jgi:hypothetical protein
MADVRDTWETVTVSTSDTGRYAEGGKQLAVVLRCVADDDG